MSKDPREAARARVGQTLNNKFTLERLIEVGGMAAVYEALHRNGKRVALKLLHPVFAQEAQVRERFLREGYAANKVDHPGAVSVLDDDTTADGSPFIVMELLVGESLESWILRSGNRLRAPEVLAVSDQVLDVLASAHAKGIVHRDIKPANLFVTKEGRVKVLDFGLARVRDGSKMAQAPTAMGIVLGTYQYMPPEQARGKSNMIDGRTDLFAVGAVMYRALTGRWVHKGESAKDILMNAMTERVAPIQTLLPDLPKDVAAVIDRALVYEMEGRWPDAKSMQSAVRDAYAALKQAPATPADIPIDVQPEELASVVIETSFGDH